TELRCEPAATYNRPEVADHPINCVDWSQATAYCEDQGARLPTEAEWMWAARNGERATKQPWGNDAASDTNVCFSSSATPRTETCPIATFPPTALGLFDIGGNVSEWTSTPFVADFRPMPGERLIVTPGGGFGYGAASVGIIPHQFSDASVHANVLGIRCARDTAE
ncbi:MAG TPA: SUMF1/EgtB/PvdO family nonheme iron enzyme, partial [Kofleriaceae bacterium]